MGMDADVIGIGPLTPRILTCGGLNYGPKHYDNVIMGSYITNEFFSCSSSAHSQDLAIALGIKDPYDLGQHFIPNDRQINCEELLEIASATHEYEEAEAILDCFQCCRQAGWVFFFRPNF